MNIDEQLESWLSAKRDASPPEGFADKVMSSVEQAAEPKRMVASVAAGKKSLVRRCVPYLIWTAAAVVCAVRVYSLIYLVFAPTSEYSVVASDTIEEPSHDDRDISRS